MRLVFTAALGSIAAGPALAADIGVNLTVPELSVAEYHRPYVAVWLERPDQSVALNLAVLYDHDMENNKGNEWLKDMRQWWRKAGRELDMPVDGLSSATRAPGAHELTFPNAAEAIAKLEPGEYRLVVEAAREVGGRELVRVPLTWPPTQGQVLEATGESELGAIKVELKP
ncbi:DUF2271 domain-containing protein [Zavarzinia sp. CC-PAN008]|uniref:DUF2271 domain-containing protein n=1 Tax=Zavarzinia sp. CC-PAN008 TaxID=3243332 RepID=UPI003F7488DE